MLTTRRAREPRVSAPEAYVSTARLPERGEGYWSGSNGTEAKSEREAGSCQDARGHRALEHAGRRARLSSRKNTLWERVGDVYRCGGANLRRRSAAMPRRA